MCIGKHMLCLAVNKQVKSLIMPSQTSAWANSNRWNLYGIFCFFVFLTANQSLAENFGPNGRLAERPKNYRQLLIIFFLSSSGRLIEIQKLFIILTILKEIFFFEAKIWKVWLKIKFKIYRQAEGATCQHMGVILPNSTFYEIFLRYNI